MTRARSDSGTQLLCPSRNAAGTAASICAEPVGWVSPLLSRSTRLPTSTVISTSAGDRAPSAATRSARPAFMKAVFTLIPVRAVNRSSSGWISFGSRVV
jgi:hypothetical protein